MPLNNSQYDSIIRSYEEKQRKSRYRLEENTQKVYEKIPAYEELDRQVSAISIEQGKKLLNGDTNALSELKLKLKELSKKRAALLKENGFPADYLTPVYECPICKDTGYVNNRKCSCFRTTMQREFVHFNEIMRSDVYSYNCINLVTGFFYTSLTQTGIMIGTPITVRVHMLNDVIRF